MTNVQLLMSNECPMNVQAPNVQFQTTTSITNLELDSSILDIEVWDLIGH